MKVVFIGCGYLGHNLSKGLIDKYDVTILGIDSPYVQYSPWFRYADVFDMGTMINQDLQDAIVIDTVSLVGNRTTSDNPDKLLRSIKYKYQGLLDVLKAKGVKRFIFFSSGGTIYGDSEMPIKEEHELNPKSLYGKSKMMLEKLIQESGIDYLILRPSNPFGGFQITNGQGVIPILINKALNQEPFDIYVDKDSVRDYFYIDDFVDILDKLIEKDISREILNVGSGVATSLQNVIDWVEKYTEKNIIINEVEKDETAVKSIVLDISKLSNLIDHQNKVSLEEGIKLEIQRIERGK